MTDELSTEIVTEKMTREQARSDTRSNLVDVGLRLFARVGYESTSVKQIAQEAGVAQGLLYHYFTSKQKLLQAIFERSIEDVRLSFAASTGGADSASRLEALIRSSFRIVQDNQEFWRLSYALRMQPAVLGDMAVPLAQWTQEILQTLEQLLGDVGYRDPSVEASILFGTIDGIAQHYTMMPDTYPLPDVIEALVSRYCRALKTDEGQDDND